MKKKYKFICVECKSKVKSNGAYFHGKHVCSNCYDKLAFRHSLAQKSYPNRPNWLKELALRQIELEEID